MKRKVGFVGWRGMVGSVLMNRMIEDGDFDLYDNIFFSTSQVGDSAPKVSCEDKLWDANDIDSLKKMEIIITCQGGDYTKSVFGKLKESGWKGIWIDAASTLRMDKDSCLVLDPLNKSSILDYIHNGGTNLIGSNCTVSLMLLAISGLVKADLVDWISSMTYQAASGAGARNMIELIRQMGQAGNHLSNDINKKDYDILDVDRKLQQFLLSKELSTECFGQSLAGSLIPWIDSGWENGQTKEEWKGCVEANKILGRPDGSKIMIDGTCVRIGAMRCHSQGLTIKLKKDVPLEDINQIIAQGNEWVDFIENEMNQTKQKLNPLNYGGNLKIGIGRVRKMNIGSEYLNAFTIGDQLLWGAAEPLKRALKIITTL